MKTLIDHGQEENQRIAETLVSDLRRQIVPLLTSTHPPNAASEINARSLSIVSDQITQKLKGLNTVKVKIYDQQGMTLFSTTENEIGQSQKNNPGFQLAVNGQVISHFVHKNKFNAFDGVMSDKDLLQTYLPITLHTKTSESTIGVFEVYSDFTQLLEDVNGALVTATAAIAVIFLLLYSILFLSMRHANRTVDKQNFALKNSLDEIESIKKGLERTVEARTNALRISNKVLEEEIEQRAAIENSIRLQEMKLHAIMDNTFTAIVTIDSGGLIRSFNSTAESLFILSSEEAINRPLSSLMPEDAQSRFIEYLEFIKQSDAQESKKSVLELAAYQRGGLRIPIELVPEDTEG